MNAAQQNLFNSMVQSACESRHALHEVAWAILGVFLIAMIIALGVAWLWIQAGGLSNLFHLNSVDGRRAIAEWLGER